MSWYGIAVVMIFIILHVCGRCFLFADSTSNNSDIIKQHKHGDIFLFTKLFTKKQKTNLQDLRAAIFSGHWKYYEHTPEDGIPWQLPLDSDLLAQSPLLKLILKILPSSNKGISEHMDSKMKVLRRGDDVRISRVCNDNESGYTLILFLSKLHNANDYGEIMFFEEDEVKVTIQPIQHSILAWPCTIPYQIQYPSISTGFGQVMLQITLYDRIDVKPVYLSHTVQPFPTALATNSSLHHGNVKELIKKTVHTALHRPIYTIDNLFSVDMLDALRDHVYKYSHYYYDDSDDVDETDNVQWISGYRTVEFVKSDMWSIISDTLSQITGHKGWYPYDVSCNLNRAWDHTRIHKDCYDKEEYTFLLYLNPEMRPGDLAGTVWYEHDDLNKIVTSVQNKYGRVALFHCGIKHSARPPQAFIKHARYTFAVKVARSKLEAVKREMGSVVEQMNELENDEAVHDWITKYIQEIHGDVDKLEQKFVELADRSNVLSKEHLMESLINAGS